MKETSKDENNCGTYKSIYVDKKDIIRYIKNDEEKVSYFPNAKCGENSGYDDKGLSHIVIEDIGI